MPEFQTKNFGKLEYEEDSVLYFPEGIPGFEQERRFLLMEQPANRPLAFLQSLTQPGLCFIALPVLTVDPHYELHMDSEDIETLGLPADRPPRIGEDVLCLAIISTAQGKPATANLKSPVIVNLKTRVAMQAIQTVDCYSYQQVLFAAEEAKCS